MSRSTINVHYLLISIFMQSFDFEYTAVKSSECPFSLNLCSQILSFFASRKPHFNINCQMSLARSIFPRIDSYLPVPKISNIIRCQNASFLHLSLLLPAVFVIGKPESKEADDLTYLILELRSLQ